MKWILTAVSIGWMMSLDASAVQIEIIHTNDLHSYLDHGDDPDHGSYAAVKSTIDRLKAEASQGGIETLVLDAGDFSEGTPLFNADDGTDSWRMIQMIGYDAITIGNHDWLCGPKKMDEIVGKVGPSTPFLGANLSARKFQNLQRSILPHVELNRAGLKIAVVGLVTRERVYRWRFKDGKIKSPRRTMRQELKRLRDRNDLVIALTHLGVDEDIELANRVEGIDLIVGGHSHTTLTEPLLVPKWDGRRVPIVQTGAHGQYVGDLLVDYQPGEPLKVLRYRLIPVLNLEGDPNIQSAVNQVEQRFEEKYGKEWLNAELASVSTPMKIPSEHPTAWGNFYVDAVREAVNADIGLDSSEFFGRNQESGPITRRSILNFYPRYFDIEHRMGWTIWTLEIKGFILEAAIKIATKQKTFLNFSNLTYDVDTTPTGPRASRIRVNGHPIRFFKTYRVAVTEGLGRGAQGIHWLSRLLLKPQDSGVPVWSAVEQKLKTDGAPQTELSAGTEIKEGWRPATADEVQSSLRVKLGMNNSQGQSDPLPSQ